MTDYGDFVPISKWPKYVLNPAHKNKIILLLFFISSFLGLSSSLNSSGTGCVFVLFVCCLFCLFVCLFVGGSNYVCRFQLFFK